MTKYKSIFTEASKVPDHVKELRRISSLNSPSDALEEFKRLVGNMRPYRPLFEARDYIPPKNVYATYGDYIIATLKGFATFMKPHSDSGQERISARRSRFDLGAIAVCAGGRPAHGATRARCHRTHR